MHRAFAGLALLASLVCACSTGSSTELDSRPLADRIDGLPEAPVSVVDGWFESAVEASPQTRFVLDGEIADAADLFVVGPVVSVTGLGALPEESRAPMDYIEFNSPDAATDFVALEIEVEVGVTESGAPPPTRVDVVMALPAPTDVESLARELAEVGRVGAIVFAAIGVPDEIQLDLYQVLDSYYIGPVDGDEVTFGTWMRGFEGMGVRTASVDEITRGAGVIELTSSGGGVRRLDPVDSRVDDDTCTEADVDVASEPGWRRFAVYSRWERAGCVVRIDVIAERIGSLGSGSEIPCETGQTRVLATAPRLGDRFTDASTSVTYLRRSVAGPDEVELPTGATFSGYASAERELWIDPTAPDTIYVVSPDAVETWTLGVEDGCG